MDDDGSYITANEKGEFQFEAVENRMKGRLYVRSLGYEEVYLDFDVDKSKMLEIVLQPKPLDLKAIEISGEKLGTKTLGDKTGATAFASFLSGTNFGVLFDIKKEKGRLTKIYYSLTTKYGFPEAPILLNVYAFNYAKKPKAWMNMDLNQVKPLHEKPILIEGGVGGWNEFDLEPYSLEFENQAVFIHFIFPNDNPAYLWEYKGSFRGEPYTREYYGPVFEDYTSFKSKSIYHLISDRNKPSNKLFVNPSYRKDGSREIPAVAIDYDVFK